MRSRLDKVVTLPTEERVVGEPRCWWFAALKARRIEAWLSYL